jgi:uncharacterized membrane protein YcaP (DUF421 family)
VLIQCITETLSIFQKDFAKEITDEYETVKAVDNEEKTVEYEYKCILFINNYNECLKHAGESKDLFAQMVSEDYRVRVEKIFLNEVQKGTVWYT